MSFLADPKLREMFKVEGGACEAVASVCVLGIAFPTSLRSVSIRLFMHYSIARLVIFTALSASLLMKC